MAVGYGDQDCHVGVILGTGKLQEDKEIATQRGQ